MTSRSDLERPATLADEGTVGRAGESAHAFGSLSGEERLRLGRLAGVLMIVGAVVAFPAGLVLEPAPALHEHLLGLGSIVAGVFVFLAPWQRISANWLHLALVVATCEIAAGVAIFSDDYAFFYVIVAMFVAFAVRDGTVLLAYTLFLLLALLLPLAYADEDAKVQAHHILVTLPVLVISAGIVRYLRDTLERRERQYRGFAHEAVSLAERIRGGHDGGETDGDLEARLGRLSSHRAAEPSRHD
jgi:hypothetical protein